MKKYFVFLFVAVAMVADIGFVGMAHAATATVTIGSPSASGIIVSVPINVSNFSGAVAGMDFKVKYNPALLTYIGFTLGSTFTGHPDPTTNSSLLLANNNLGIFAFNWFDISNTLDINNGKLITLNFTTASSTAATAADFTFIGSPLDLASIIGDALPSSFIPDVIVSTSAPSITSTTTTTSTAVTVTSVSNSTSNTTTTGIATTVTNTIPTSTSDMTVAQLQTLLASLEAQLVSLEAQAGSNNANGNVSSATTSNFVFTRDLQLGMTGNDVKQLQLFLIAQNSGAAAQKLKTNGATTYFGLLTKSALIEFQKKEKITPASGYFGLKTRAWIAK